MGLYGALVVRPATAGQAYDAAARRTTTRRVLRAQRDRPRPEQRGRPRRPSTCASSRPALLPRQRQGAPGHRRRSPASGGRSCCCATSTPGTSYHSMGVLGADQTVVALDGSQLTNGASTSRAATSRRRSGPARPPTPRHRADDGRGPTASPSTTPACRCTTRNTAGAGGMLTFLAGHRRRDRHRRGRPGDPRRRLERHRPVRPRSSDVRRPVPPSRPPSTSSTPSAPRAPAPRWTPRTARSAPPPRRCDPPLPRHDPATARHGPARLYVRGPGRTGNWGPFSSVLVMGADAVGPTTSAGSR